MLLYFESCHFESESVFQVTVFTQQQVSELASYRKLFPDCRFFEYLEIMHHSFCITAYIFPSHVQ